MRAFVAEAMEADRDIERTGELYAAEDVHAWMERLVQGKKPRRPKPWRRWSMGRESPLTWNDGSCSCFSKIQQAELPRPLPYTCNRNVGEASTRWRSDH